MAHDENKAFLRRVPLFASLSEAQIDMLAALDIAGTRGQQHQQWPQPLAAAIDNVGGQLVDQGHVAGQALPDQCINCSNIV